MTAEQDVRGYVAIHVRQYGPDGRQGPEVLALRPEQADQLASALDRALHVAGVRVRR